MVPMMSTVRNGNCQMSLFLRSLVIIIYSILFLNDIFYRFSLLTSYLLNINNDIERGPHVVAVLLHA